MKLVKTASGKQTIKISKTEWKSIGKKAGWLKEASFPLDNSDMINAADRAEGEVENIIAVATYDEPNDRVDYQARARIMSQVAQWCSEMAESYQKDAERFGIVS